MFERSSRSIRAQSCALRSIPSDVVLECSSLDETEVSLVQRECRADFPEESSQLLDPSEWRLGAYSGFFREENIIVLEACSVSYAVRCAQRNYPTGRLLILSEQSCAGTSALQRTLKQQSCVVPLRLVSGQVLSYRSGGYRRR